MIDILMATYNGEKFLNEQIDSIINQSFKDWKLYIRDDGSNDNTKVILNSYAEKYKDKIIIINDDKGNLRSKLCFNELLKYSNSEYIMFSDQDDVWIENKIEVMLKKIKEAEVVDGKIIPCVVHSDLKVVNSKLETINPSLWNYEKINPKKNSFNRLLMKNTITGCTIIMNKSLKNLVGDIPINANMHDHWIALVASAFGKIEILPEPTILYRQHDNNVVGALKQKSNIDKMSGEFFKSIPSKIFNGIDIHTFDSRFNQAKAFKEIYGNDLNKEQAKILDEVINLPKYNSIKMKYEMINKKLFLFHNFKDNLKYIIKLK